MMSETSLKRVSYSLRSRPFVTDLPPPFEDNAQVAFDYPISLTRHQIDGAANKQALFVGGKYMHELQMMDK